MLAAALFDLAVKVNTHAVRSSNKNKPAWVDWNCLPVKISSIFYRGQIVNDQLSTMRAVVQRVKRVSYSEKLL